LCSHHGEEQSDEATRLFSRGRFWIASLALAMTGVFMTVLLG
jgi:hypothetical protein